MFGLTDIVIQLQASSKPSLNEKPIDFLIVNGSDFFFFKDLSLYAFNQQWNADSHDYKVVHCKCWEKKDLTHNNVQCFFMSKNIVLGSSWWFCNMNFQLCLIFRKSPYLVYSQYLLLNSGIKMRRHLHCDI